MVIMNYLEWPMISYYVILYEKFRRVMHWTEKVALIDMCISKFLRTYTVSIASTEPSNGKRELHNSLN